jgi:hypothetical protein
VLYEATDHCWSFFLKEKSNLTSEVMQLVNNLKENFPVRPNTLVVITRARNMSLEKLCKQEGLGVQFDYTILGTPQHNGRIVRKFTTLYRRARSMLNGIGNNLCGKF